MKRLTFLLMSGVMLMTACSKSDSNSVDRFAGVPKGTIVPVEERQMALTGIEDHAKMKTTHGDQKWWEQVEAKVDYHCGDKEDEDLSPEGTYYAFKPDGKIWYKVGLNGNETPYHSWKWENSSKDAIIVKGVRFELRELNDGGLVYASYQEQSSDCYAITWEKFVH